MNTILLVIFLILVLSFVISFIACIITLDTPAAIACVITVFLMLLFGFLFGGHSEHSTRHIYPNIYPYSYSYPRSYWEREKSNENNYFYSILHNHIYFIVALCVVNLWLYTGLMENKNRGRFILSRLLFFYRGLNKMPKWGYKNLTHLK